MKLLRRLLIGVVVVGILVPIFLCYIGVLGNNFRVVSDGKCYRSAQLKADALKKAIEAHGIKTVLNLRGERDKEPWYHDEMAACAAEKVEHIDVNVGLGALPKPADMKLLVEKLEGATYPMLIHCRSGSDRTGLGSALYLHLIEKMPLQQAEAEQVTWRYGHFPIGKAKCINEFFELYLQTSGGKSIKDWIYDVYPAEYEKSASTHSKKRLAD